MEAPELNVDELRSELALVHRTKHRTFHTLLCARAASDVSVSIMLHDGERVFRTRAVACELDIRRALAAPPDGESLALLVDHDLGPMPADLVGRLAKGKTIAVDPRRRLTRLFGVQSLSPELLAHPNITKALLARPLALAAARADLQALDFPTAVRTLLQRDAGLPADGELHEERLLHHVATRLAPDGAAAALGAGSPLAEDIEAYLAQRVGVLAPIFWRAWLAGKGRLAAALTFLLHSAAGGLATSAGLRAVLSVVLRSLDEGLSSAPTDRPALLARWGALAPGLRRRLEASASSFLAEADALVPSDEIRGELYDSPFLPSAFDTTSDRLAAALDAALSLGAQRIDAVRTELERLAAHDLARDERSANGEIVLRARMAARLVTYLACRPNLDEKARLFGSNGAVIALAAHYVSDGSYVDYARDRARGHEDSPLEAAIGRVVAKIDETRDGDDDAFAGAYVAWLSSGSPKSEHVVPIADGIEVFAERFLKNQPHRRLLVLLLDGMSWANAVELLHSCDDARYAPLRVGGNGLQRHRPMLAALPSLTGVSRSAFFGGKAIKSGQPLATASDAARFAAHPSWRRLRIEPEPDLLLKDRFETQAGDPSKEALDAVASEARVVGMVVNALDDQLKGPRQMRVPADLEHIRPLRRLLAAAIEGRRAVLLVADHGHVRTSRMSATGRPGDGKRYRYAGAGDAVVPGEVTVSRDFAWTPAGKTHATMLVRETEGYGAIASSGEHGGASLAEVVAPAILIGHEQLRERVRLEVGVDDPELDIAPLARPDFWDLDIPRSAASKLSSLAPPTEKPVTAGKGRKNTPSPQLALPTPGVPVAAAPSPWLARLTKLPWRLDESQTAERQKLMSWIAFLAESGGSVSVDAFARHCELAVRNVGVAVTEVQEAIDFDGYAVVVYEPTSKRVVLHRDTLESFLGAP